MKLEKFTYLLSCQFYFPISSHPECTWPPQPERGGEPKASFCCPFPVGFSGNHFTFWRYRHAEKFPSKYSFPPSPSHPLSNSWKMALILEDSEKFQFLGSCRVSTMYPGEWWGVRKELIVFHLALFSLTFRSGGEQLLLYCNAFRRNASGSDGMLVLHEKNVLN